MDFEDRTDEMGETRANYRFFLRQRPARLALMAALAALFFLAVTGLSRAYHTQRAGLGNRWSVRGTADMDAKRYDAAATDFRAALLYAPDDYSYQLNLAEALIGLKKTGQASAYLLNLWDRQPQDGLVNLELARISAQQRNTEQAIRYYNDAVYAAWTPDQEFNRREARLELIELLLAANAKPQAQAELMALEENAGNDGARQEQIGELFLRADDPERALAAFRASLKAQPRNPGALAGAGNAAFELARYPLAQRYLQAAVAANASDAQSADRLKTVAMVLDMDPYGRQVSPAQRNRLTIQAFGLAGNRLKSCAPAGLGAVSGQPSLSDQWKDLNPKITERGLQRDRDLMDSAMDLVFSIEKETADSSCGPPSGQDLALLLIANLHEASQ